MNQIRRILDNAGVYIGKMSATQKLLIASLVVIASMTLFLVSQYASTPARVELMAQTGDTAALSALTRAGIDAEVVNGSIQVPPNQRASAVAVLSEAGQLPGDTQLMFRNLIDSQDWKASREQHRQQYYIALQNELSRVITRFSSVTRASVILDVPERSGLGRAAREPSASVTIFGSGGSALSQGTVDAAAGLVMGAVSGLGAERVRVIDGTSGSPRMVSTEDSRLSSKFFEFAREVERAKKHQILDMLSHIPGVKVTVTAMVDVTRVAKVERAYSPEQRGSVSMLRSQSGMEDSVEEATRGAEPGVRSNQTASINTGSNSGTRASASETTKEFENQFGYTEQEIVDPRGMPTHIRASIVIPEEYVAELITRRSDAGEQADAGDADAVDASPEAIRERFEGVGADAGLKGLIADQVKPHLIGQDAGGAMIDGEVVVSMTPFGDAYRAGAGVQNAGFMGTLVGGGAGGALGNGNLIETALVGVLALIAFVMMLMMVRRSGKKLPMPSAEELVGVPPQLEGMEELIGEADETESAMAGIEVDDAMIQVQKLREQVGELIAADPQNAASMVERWADIEE